VLHIDPLPPALSGLTPLEDPAGTPAPA
jgi:hypothetical protein